MSNADKLAAEAARLASKARTETGEYQSLSLGMIAGIAKAMEIIGAMVVCSKTWDLYLWLVSELKEDNGNADLCGNRVRQVQGADGVEGSRNQEGAPMQRKDVGVGRDGGSPVLPEVPGTGSERRAAYERKVNAYIDRLQGQL
jgi:hypothetical protein